MAISSHTAAERALPWLQAAELSTAGVGSVDEYADAVASMSRIAGGRSALFRGESQFYAKTSCTPRLAREAEVDDFKPLSETLRFLPGPGQTQGPPSVILREEADILHAFREWFVEMNPNLRAPAVHSTEWLDLAQHYGAPTRLLDTTTSPLIALFFACWNPDSVCDPSGDGLVYIAESQSSVRFQTVTRAEFRNAPHDLEIQQAIADNYLDFFESWTMSDTHKGAPHRYRPLAANAEINRRISAQLGEFFWTSDPSAKKQWFPILIRGEAKPGLLRTLSKLHIDPHSLFPDTHGESWQREFDDWMLSGAAPIRTTREAASFTWSWPGNEHSKYSHLFSHR